MRKSDGAAEILRVVRRVMDCSTDTTAGFVCLDQFGQVYQETRSLVRASAVFTGNSTASTSAEFFGERLSQVRAYKSIAHAALFWGLSDGEHLYASEFSPQKSHEERMTGKLAAMLVCSMRSVRDQMEGALESSNSSIAFGYLDTATDRREKYSGADLGLIVQVVDRSQSRFRVLRVQCKKVDPRGHAKVAHNQLRVLIESGVGAFLWLNDRESSSAWYQMTSSRRPLLTPTITVAQRVRGIIGRVGAGNGTTTIPVPRNAIDLASIVTFDMGDDPRPPQGGGGSPKSGSPPDGDGNDDMPPQPPLPVTSLESALRTLAPLRTPPPSEVIFIKLAINAQASNDVSLNKDLNFTAGQQWRGEEGTKGMSAEADY